MWDNVRVNTAKRHFEVATNLAILSHTTEHYVKYALKPISPGRSPPNILGAKGCSFSVCEIVEGTGSFICE